MSFCFRILSFFYTQDFGQSVGTFVRVSYSINTSTESYIAYSKLAICGIILYPIGIPLLFFIMVKHRKHTLLIKPSALLHEDFVDAWAYFDVCFIILI